jgi:hypothetical protein
MRELELREWELGKRLGALVDEMQAWIRDTEPNAGYPRHRSLVIAFAEMLCHVQCQCRTRGYRSRRADIDPQTQGWGEKDHRATGSHGRHLHDWR